MNEVLFKFSKTESQNTTGDGVSSTQEVNIVVESNEPVFSSSQQNQFPPEKETREVTTLSDVDNFISYFSKLQIN